MFLESSVDWSSKSSFWGVKIRAPQVVERLSLRRIRCYVRTPPTVASVLSLVDRSRRNEFVLMFEDRVVGAIVTLPCYSTCLTSTEKMVRLLTFFFSSFFYSYLTKQPKLRKDATQDRHWSTFPGGLS